MSSMGVIWQSGPVWDSHFDRWIVYPEKCCKRHCYCCVCYLTSATDWDWEFSALNLKKKKKKLRLLFLIHIFHCTLWMWSTVWFGAGKEEFTDATRVFANEKATRVAPKRHDENRKTRCVIFIVVLKVVWPPLTPAFSLLYRIFTPPGRRQHRGNSRRVPTAIWFSGGLTSGVTPAPPSFFLFG